MTNQPARPAQLAPEIEPIVLAVLEARVKEAKAAARAPLAALYAEGDKRVIRSPLDDRKLGTVYRTDPDPAWKVTDRAALVDHLMDDPANVEYVEELAVTGPALLDLLTECLPADVLDGLIARVERVREDAVAQALATARDGGEIAPGIERIKPAGTLAVRPDKQAGAAIEALVAAEWITYDGQPLALPAAEEPPAPEQEEKLPEEGWCTFGCGGQVHWDRRPARDADGKYGHYDCMTLRDARRAAPASAVQVLDEIAAASSAAADADSEVAAS